MAKNKQDDSSKHPAADSDDQMEQLSKNEKLAFEKIINEIEDVNTNNDQTQSNPAGSGQARTHNPKGGSEKTMTNTNEDEGKTAPEPEIPKTDAQGQAETLDDEQQAALDKIMAEINGDENDSAPAPEPEQEASSTEAQDQAESLDDEQQAALDKIMTEINGDENDSAPAPEPEQEPPSTEAQDQAESLDDEQQAALDKIMTEINGDDKDDAPAKDDSKPEPETPPSPPEDSEFPADSESPAKTQDDAIADTSQDQPPETPKTRLSLEEFNDELTNLLSAADSPDEKSVSSKIAEEPAEKADEPDDPSPSIEDRPVSKERQDNPASDIDEANDYTILQEVTEKESKTSKQPRKARGTKTKTRKKYRIIQYSIAALLLIGICTAVYWRYGLPIKKTAPTPLLAETPNVVSPPPAERLHTPLPDTPMIEAVEATKAPDSNDALLAKVPTIPSLASLREKITSTREHVILKIDEVQELQAYYQKGVDELRKKIIDSAITVKTTSLKTVIENKQMELDLRAIQRRMIYAEKLDIPIKELTSSSEELLYLERKTKLLEALQRGVTGLFIDAFQKEALHTIDKHHKSSNKLTIDHIEVIPPSLVSIWTDIQSSTTAKPAKQKKINSKQDSLIHKEICKGNFERKYLLTALKPKSAECVSKWPGKDLYLNGLAKLPPSVAKTLSQWPGEWLSLNGLSDLPDESAKYLSQWKGKRLSLNGLSRLSKKATQHLSKWEGEQLEMVGLKTIGRWENYGTHLYLSENLSRKLQIQ